VSSCFRTRGALDHVFNRNRCSAEMTGVTSDGLLTFTPTGRFQTNDVHSIYAAVLGGLGISQGPSWLYGAQVRSGTLRALLPAYAPPLVPIYAVSAAGRRQRSTTIKGFIDYLAEILSSEPDLRKR
jgi:DNA-binding transcriptional LysR family regulator